MNFSLFKHAADKDWLARQPQHYFYGRANNKYAKNNPAITKVLTKGQSTAFTLDMVPPTGGWKKGGRFRIQSRVPLEGTKWKAILNGIELKPTDDCSEPYKTPYTNYLGTPETLRAWIVKPEMLIDGDNIVEVTMTSGDKEVTLLVIDFGLE